MIVFLEVTPRWPTDAVPVRVCSAANPRAQTWNAQKWAAALFDPGSLSMSLFSGEIGTEIDSSAAPVVLAEKALLELFPDAVDVRWEGAAYRMWAGDFDPGTPGAYMDYVARSDPYLAIGGDRLMIGGNLLTMAMTIDAAPGLAVEEVSRGKITRFEKDGGAMKLSLDPKGVAGDTKVLVREYAGTTGVEGGPNLKGTLKPWIFGHAKNVEPVLINEDDNVYQFSGYGPIQSVDALFERGSSFGASFGDYANYSALVAAAIPAGRWATCLAEGLIRLGAPQFGVITGDVKGDYAGSVQRRHPGAILQRVASERGISADAIDSASLAALDAFALTLPDDGFMNIVLREQETFLDLARRICAQYNAQAGFTLMGRLIAARVVVGSPTFTIDAQGRRQPLVGRFVEADTPAPYKTIIMSGDISWRVHDLANDIAFYATPVERGIYADAETYREGDIVSIADGSRWIYVNPTPTAGNDPADASSYWSRLSEPATGPAGPPGVDGTDGADGEDGTDGLPGLTISASPPVFNVARTAGGSPKAGELPKSLQVQVLDGETDVTASCSFSKTDTECSISNDGAGAFTLTALDAGEDEAFTEIEAAYGARTVPIKITVAKPRDGSAASRASASVTSMNASATYAAIATVDLVVADGATVSGSASVTYLAASFVGGGTRTVRQQAKVSIQNLTDAGSEVDGTAQIGSAASYIGGDGPSDVGQVSASQSVTNSTGATKTFRLKFYIRYYDGATTAQTGGGTYSGSIEAQAA